MSEIINGSRNLLLNAMQRDDRALLSPLLRRVPLEREQVLVRADQPIEFIYFPESGVASIISGVNGERTEVGIFGREGLSGAALILGADRSPHETFMQVGDATGLRLPAAALTEAMDASVTLRTLLLRYMQGFLVQVAMSAVSNGRCRMDVRLARWLLMCHDRSDGDEIALTHEFMAMMIAAQRTGVTLTLHILEGEGLIRSLRGRVVIVDRAGLEALAGDSYGRAEAEYRRLIGPFGRSTDGPACVSAQGR